MVGCSNSHVLGLSRVNISPSSLKALHPPSDSEVLSRPCKLKWCETFFIEMIGAKVSSSSEAFRPDKVAAPFYSARYFCHVRRKKTLLPGGLAWQEGTSKL
ncbi:hypothetical protein OPV22_004521 [Ensete ventricosum]|uniref:Uncharacterized protein n=1 Tax=Ensete ventricosum TaxID=4639 RepID=A0AAV8S411_ENSVE|nr:hypothetical protein OPV22_004521 [Ensete ventricosum]